MNVPTTVFRPDAAKTDETDLVGNGEFPFLISYVS